MKTKFLILPGILSLCCLFSSCKSELNLNDFVSERREFVYLAESDGATLKIQSGERETPYCSDGKKGSVVPFLEIFFTGEAGTDTPAVKLTIGGKEYGGEMNFDKIKNVYTLSMSVVCEEKSLSAVVTAGEKQFAFTAENKRRKEHLSDEAVLAVLYEREKTLIDSLTQKNVLSAELAVRFLYDDGCYFYTAVTEESGKITALLLNATSGEVLARKTLND